MELQHAIRRITQPPPHAGDLSEDEAHGVFSALLDGGVADLQLAALLTAFRVKTESTAELLGFHRATSERMYGMTTTHLRARPLVIPAYGGARNAPNLLPLLGLLLRRIGVPVLFHGTLESSAGVASIYILREFGVLPSPNVAHAQAALEQTQIAFLPIAALCPGLAHLLALRNQLGVRNSAHVVAKLIDPFAGAGVILAGASDPAALEKLRSFFMASGGRGVLLPSNEGEPFANPVRRPRIEYIEQGTREVLFEEEAFAVKPGAATPCSVDAQGTAQWMRLALAAEAQIPHPLVNQLAACLYACRYVDDMNQAKAISAMEAGSLVPRARVRRASAGRPRSAMS